VGLGLRVHAVVSLDAAPATSGDSECRTGYVEIAIVHEDVASFFGPRVPATVAYRIDLLVPPDLPARDFIQGM